MERLPRPLVRLRSRMVPRLRRCWWQRWHPLPPPALPRCAQCKTLQPLACVFMCACVARHARTQRAANTHEASQARVCMGHVKFGMRNTCITCRLNTSLRNLRGKDASFRGKASAAAAAEATTLLLLSLMIPMPGARRWSPADPASASARNCMLSMPCVIDLRQPLPVRHLRVRVCAYVIVSGWVVYQVDRTWCTKRASGERSS
jgi:hypothetical protein